MKRDLGEALVVELAGNKTAVVEIDLVLLFRAPLAVVEDHGGDRNVVTHAGHGFHQAHAPRTVAGIRDSRAMRCRDLGADDGRERIAAIAPAHRGEEAARDDCSDAGHLGLLAKWHAAQFQCGAVPHAVRNLCGSRQR